MSGICGRQRPLERLPRRIEIIDALTSPNQLKRVTADFRARIARRQHTLGQAASSIDVVAGERHLCLEDPARAARGSGSAASKPFAAPRRTLAPGHLVAAAAA